MFIVTIIAQPGVLLNTSSQIGTALLNKTIFDNRQF